MDIVTAARKKKQAEDLIEAIIKSFQNETGLLVDDIKLDWIEPLATRLGLTNSILCIELKVSFGL